MVGSPCVSMAVVLFTSPEASSPETVIDFASPTDISQIPECKRPSYPNGLLESTENGLRRRRSHRLCRSNVPILSPTPQEQRFHPVSAQH